MREAKVDFTRQDVDIQALNKEIKEGICDSHDGTW